MITKLTNFIGNKKVIWGGIFIIVVLIIGYSFFFCTTRKEFDTDGDGEIDKIEYYRKRVKIKEAVYFDKVYPKGISYIYWNKDGSINKIMDIYWDDDLYLSKEITSYSKGENVYRDGKIFIKQESVRSEGFDRKGRKIEVRETAKYYIYLKERKFFLGELAKNNGEIYKMILFDPHGRISQTKEDKDSNGKFEYYEFYEHGKKTAVGYDYDEDGEIDKKEEVKNKHKE